MSYNNVMIKNLIVDYEQGASDVRCDPFRIVTAIPRTFAFEERVMVNPQVSLLDLTEKLTFWAMWCMHL